MPMRLTRTGEFTGYASLFHVRDDAGDIVLPGAFRRTLQRLGAAGVRMLWQHDVTKPIGVWREIREDSRGLFVRGELAIGSFAGREVAELIRIGAVDGLSIGFRTLRASRDRLRKARLLHEVELWEISLVTFPMLRSARIRPVGTAHALAEVRGLTLTPVRTKRSSSAWRAAREKTFSQVQRSMTTKESLHDRDIPRTSRNQGGLRSGRHVRSRERA